MLSRLSPLAISIILMASFMLSSLSLIPAMASGLPIDVAPLAPVSVERLPVSQTRQTQQTQQVRTQAGAKHLVATHKSRNARVSRAAICTEDISEISFSEYTVDWTAWMKDVASRWSIAFNSTGASSGLRSEGPILVQFTCNSDGSIRDVVLMAGTGDLSCDHRQIEALGNCLPLPKFPAGCKKKNVTMLFVWDYGVTTRVAAKRRSAKTIAHHIQAADPRISISGKTL